MRRTLAKALSLFLCLATVATAVPVPARAQDARPGVVEQMVNQNAKLRVGRILLEGIRDSRAPGMTPEKADLKSRVLNKPLLTHLAIDVGSDVAGKVVQWGMSGLCPPFGLIAGTVLSTTLNSFGGAVGYGVSRSMETGEKLDARQMFGKALTELDMPDFIGKNIGSVAGAMIGSALIPIPFIGTAVGGMVGGIVGTYAVRALRKIGAFDRAAAKLQARWVKVGERVMAGGNRPPAPADPTVVLAASAASPAAPGLGDDGALRRARDEVQALHERYMNLARSASPGDAALAEAARRLEEAQKRLRELQNR